MPNNIAALNAELALRDQEKRDEAAETFSEEALTPQEKEALAELGEQKAHTVVTEASVSTPITEYAAPLDTAIGIIGTGKAPLKLVNTGDVVQSKDDLKRESRERALRTFKDLAVTGDEISDDEIVRINDSALEALKNRFKTGNLTADLVSKNLNKLPLARIVEMLPAAFVRLYTTDAELRSNNAKARERLIASLVYLTTVGPEMDYLNDYIENGHRLTLVSQRLLQCSVDLVAALKSEEKISEIADRAAELDPPRDMPWEKYITGDARRVHNAFAQTAAIYEQYVKAYSEIRNEYDDMESLTLIDEQIAESQMKVDVYSSICRLEFFKEMVTLTETWLKGNPKLTYQRLLDLGLDAIDRIRRSKQDVPFPTYDPKLAKYPKEMLTRYMKEFPAMLGNYNSALIKLQAAATPEELADMPKFIQLDGILEATVHDYFAILLLIVYGRIMKNLTKNTATKRDAILLDEYFVLFCSIGTDSYLMDDVWTIMKPLVAYAINNWHSAKTRR